MTADQKFIGIIPSRYASARFPGKPLADILGRPMFWHVYHQALKCSLFDRVLLATDDLRILEAAKGLLIPAVMTSREHNSGTDRVLEAAQTLGASDQSVIVNIQGDEPALDPEMLDQLLSPFVSGTDVGISTLARPVGFDEAQNINLVKVVFSGTGKALYFSRSVIPHPGENASLFAHVGLYAFRMKLLKSFSKMGQGRLERIERLEQLRLLEADIPIQVMVTERVSHGVDTPEDIKKVTKIIQEKHNESSFSP